MKQIVILSGGLGNQMFQYALYLALKDKGKKVKLDTSLYSHVEMHNGYELEKCFGLNDPLIEGGYFHILYLRMLLKFKPANLLFGDILQYNDKIFETRCKYINGSWQCEKYFKHIDYLVRSAFAFRNIDTQNQNLATEIASQNAISIHLRRGDYLGNSIYSGICTEKYYLTSTEELINKLSSNENVLFYIFSDDKNYANQFLSKFNYPAKLINHNKSTDSYKDMFLMSQCKHNIIANSSFSWWGAWLNANPEKIVIAPKRWFGVGSEDSYKDIVPENWIKV